MTDGGVRGHHVFAEYAGGITEERIDRLTAGTVETVGTAGMVGDSASPDR